MRWPWFGLLSEVGFEPTPTEVDCDLNAAPWTARPYNCGTARLEAVFYTYSNTSKVTSFSNKKM